MQTHIPLFSEERSDNGGIGGREPRRPAEYECLPGGQTEKTFGDEEDSQRRQDEDRADGQPDGIRVADGGRRVRGSTVGWIESCIHTTNPENGRKLEPSFQGINNGDH